MISQQYIDDFKATKPFDIISKGILQGDIESVLLGKDEYRITSQYEMEDTDPLQVLVSIHILVSEGRIESELINQVLKKLIITPKIVCLILSYIDNYIWYLNFHADFKLDYIEIFNSIKTSEPKFQNLPCFKNLINSIENNITNGRK